MDGASVPGENLTRLEAQERRSIVDVQSYEIALDLTRGDEVFGSSTTVRFTATPGASTFIDALTRTVHSVVLNGTTLDAAAVSDGVRIQLDDLAAENVLEVVADAEYTNTGEGLHRFVDPVDGEVYLYSQFEVPDSRRVFAVFEQPDLKATFQFTVTAPARWQVVSNQTTPEPVVDGENGTWTFAATSPARTAARSPSGSSPGARSPSTSTPTTSSRRPVRASRTTRRSSSTRTRSRSTTSCSCPSSTRAPWRTRGP
jgi:aminopeptidase N